jgi:hypothetical protein
LDIHPTQGVFFVARLTRSGLQPKSAPPEVAGLSRSTLTPCSAPAKHQHSCAVSRHSLPLVLLEIGGKPHEQRLRRDTRQQSLKFKV